MKQRHPSRRRGGVGAGGGRLDAQAAPVDALALGDESFEESLHLLEGPPLGLGDGAQHEEPRERGCRVWKGREDRLLRRELGR